MRLEYDEYHKQVIFRMDEHHHKITVAPGLDAILQEQDLLMIRAMCDAALQLLYTPRLTKIDDPIPLKSKKGKC